MLTKRQNLLETIHGGKPDRFVKQYEAFGMIVGNAFSKHNPAPKPGEENIVNAWGVTRSWPKGTPGAFPVHKPDTIVIKDIEECPSTARRQSRASHGPNAVWPTVMRADGGCGEIWRAPCSSTKKPQNRTIPAPCAIWASIMKTGTAWHAI